MICPNCRGKKVFADLRCLCLDIGENQADPNCKTCQGKGTHDSICPLCEGRGEVPDRYTFGFANEETRQIVLLTVDANDLPALEKRGSDYQMWVLPIDKLFDDVCKKLGVSEETHFLYHNGEAIEFGWGFSYLIVASGKYKTEEELKELSKEAIGRHFAWYKKGPKNLIWGEFRKRHSTEELFDYLWDLVSQFGYTFEIATWEGNIATGENGWSIFLNSPSGKKLAEIGLAYTLAVALRQALDTAPGVLTKLEEERDQ